MPPAVFVFGHTATGKTLVVTRMLENLQYIYAVVNCVECYMPQLLFEPVLNKIHGNYHCLCNCSIIYSFTKYNLFTSIYSIFTDSEAALLYHISEIKSCISWGRKKKSYVLRWSSSFLSAVVFLSTPSGTFHPKWDICDYCHLFSCECRDKVTGKGYGEA